DDPWAKTLFQLSEDAGTVDLALSNRVALLCEGLREIHGSELIDERLVSVTGRFRLTPSHLDVFMPLDTVRIELRLAGFDLNPGGVPGPGRVVPIHYVKPHRGAEP